MVYISLNYYLFLAALVAVYYILPLKRRWLALLAGSLGFYCAMSPAGFPLFLLSIAAGWGIGRGLDAPDLPFPFKGLSALQKRQLLFGLGVAAALAPLLAVRLTGFRWLPALGVSFFSLQTVAYLSDVYHGKIKSQPCLLRYALFVSFFPQIVQGPIPRYEQLGEQLWKGHSFDERQFTKSLHLILWGFFLKLMLADKAGVFVDAVFGQFPIYQGSYVLAAGVLYSLQLYTDFLACVTISQGAAGLFGVSLADNFDHPYSARSIQEFWRRWHMTLSAWLRDYIYIPLGGNRRGTVLKYVNLTIVFAVSGLWHGAGWKFLLWGMLHAAYQIAGGLLRPWKDRLYTRLGMPEDSLARRGLQTAGTCFWVMLAWIVFRADTLAAALGMLRSLFTFYNPWVLFDGSLFLLGLNGREWTVLALSALVLWAAGRWQRRLCVRDWILEQHLVVRWAIYLAAVCAVWVFGTYGFGFGQDFIYGGF